MDSKDIEYRKLLDKIFSILEKRLSENSIKNENRFCYYCLKKNYLYVSFLSKNKIKKQFFKNILFECDFKRINIIKNVGQLGLYKYELFLYPSFDENNEKNLTYEQQLLRIGYYD